VIGAVGSEAKKDFCLKQGCDAVVVRSGSFKSDLHKVLNGRELSVVMEAIGGRTFRDSFALLAPRGRIAIYGFAEYMPHGLLSYAVALWRYLRRPWIDTLRLNNRLVAGFNLIFLFSHADDIGKYVDEIRSLGIGKPYVGATYKFEELPKAVEVLKSGTTIGKVIVVV
jgi:NADPH:quinone reductase-like Zn-dependent oxidoreductase